MNIVNKLVQLNIVVTDMPKAKEFYADKLGLKVDKDYRQDDDNWYVTVVLPEGGVTITLTTNKGDLKPGMMQLYFATSDITAAHKELHNKGVKVSEVQDDLYGPGSGVKFINFEDPEGNAVLLAQE